MYKTPDFLFSKYSHFLQTYIVVTAVCIVACRVGVFFGRANVFASEKCLAKTSKERRKWEYPMGYYFYSPQSSSGLKSKMAGTTLRT